MATGDKIFLADKASLDTLKDKVNQISEDVDELVALNMLFIDSNGFLCFKEGSANETSN